MTGAHKPKSRVKDDFINQKIRTTNFVDMAYLKK